MNSSILNAWNTTPLLLAGLWVPPTHVTQEAVVQGVDAALCFTDEEPRESRSLVSPEPPKLDADLAFRLIIDSATKAIPTSMQCVQDEAAALSNTPSLSSSYGLLTIEERPTKTTPDVDQSDVSESPFEAAPAIRDDTGADKAEIDCPFETLTSCEDEPLRRNVTFEDLLVNYSVSSIGVYKAPEMSSVTKPDVQRTGSGDSEFEVVAGNLTLILFEFDANVFFLRAREAVDGDDDHVKDDKPRTWTSGAELPLLRLFAADWFDLRAGKSLRFHWRLLLS